MNTYHLENSINGKDSRSFNLSVLLKFSVEKRCHPRAEDRELGMAVKKDQLAIFYNYLGLWLQR
jgi:hypothetical protein